MPYTYTNTKPVKGGWVKRGKVWTDKYHPNTYREADGSKHSRKKPR